jgi:hypothetical protein
MRILSFSLKLKGNKGQKWALQHAQNHIFRSGYRDGAGRNRSELPEKCLPTRISLSTQVGQLLSLEYAARRSLGLAIYQGLARTQCQSLTEKVGFQQSCLSGVSYSLMWLDTWVLHSL